ncbi:MAG: hypothetical protein FJY92_04770 [Candidatus Hydrogenedentes bacterium]|nr:hypothetical protein [Candidatus Hydrogenedentota bacterium]
MESASLGFLLFLFVFALLFVLLLSALTFVPAYILWRRTRDKRYPMMWVTCSSLIIALAAAQTFFRDDSSPQLNPINETLTGVADKSGTLRVTALRIPNPEQPQVRIEVDAENSSDTAQLLGIQCSNSSAQADASLSDQTTTHYIWSVDPKWKGALTCDAQLPGVVYDGVVTIVLARCNSKTPGGDNWLPTDSEAIYQNRFNLFPSTSTPGH